MDFATIKSEVESWLLDLPAGATSRTGGWVNEAIKAACRRHNFMFMRTQIQASTTINQSSLVSKPALWKANREVPFLIRQDGSVKELNWSTTTQNIRTYGVTLPQEGSTAPADVGEPRYVHEGATFLFVYPLSDNKSDWADEAYRVNVPYFGYPAALVQNADTNWLTDNAEYYCIFKAVALGFAWNRDSDRSLEFEARAEVIFKSAVRADKMNQMPSRLTLSVAPNVYQPETRSGYKR